MFECNSKYICADEIVQWRVNIDVVLNFPDINTTETIVSIHI